MGKGIPNRLSIRALILWIGWLLLVAPAPAAPQDPKAGPLTPVAEMQLLPELRSAVKTGKPARDTMLDICVGLQFLDPQGARELARSVSDPTSADYRRFLSPAAIGSRFGPPKRAVEELAAYLRSNDLTVTLVSSNRLAVSARGTVAQAERAFGTRIAQFERQPGNRFEPLRFLANEAPIRLPKRLAGLVCDVAGLETFTHPRPRVTLLNPFLTRTLYGTQPLFELGKRGEGRNLAIANWDGFRQENWLLYIDQFNLPAPILGPGSNIHVIPVNGPGSGGGEAVGEGDLDIQMQLGMAPLADIHVYDGTNTLTSVLAKISEDNLADVVSESYGWNLPGSTAVAANNLHVALTLQGITYIAASGDAGTTLEPFSYPNYDPEVLLVGGTIANVNGTTGARLSEVGWSGSGGGWSTNPVAFNVRPIWQTGTGVPPVNASNNYRLGPDVALHSSGSGTGAYYFFFEGSMMTGFVGTSFASPVFAGCLALVQQSLIDQGAMPPDTQGKRRLGRLQDLIYYQNGRDDVWFDVVSGSNGQLPNGQGASNCGPEWDTVTGWGAVQFSGLMQSLLGATDVSPTSLSTVGDLLFGNLASLKAIDGDRLKLQVSNASDDVYPIGIVIEATSPLYRPGRMALSATLQASIPGRQLLVRLWDWSQGRFITVGTVAAPTSETTLQFEAPGDVTRFLQPGTRKMRARLDLFDVASEEIIRWTTSFDRAVWMLYG